MKWWAAALMFGSVLLASCSNGDTPVPPDDANDMGNAPSGVRLIDLGLPSGTKWANMDIGAAGENQPGLFFAFGEVEGYDFDTDDGHYFFWNTYKWGSGAAISAGITKYQMDDHEEGCWYMMPTAISSATARTCLTLKTMPPSCHPSCTVIFATEIKGVSSAPARGLYIQNCKKFFASLNKKG